MHILAVDDDLQTLTLIDLLLTRQGYRVSRASGGQEALDLVAAKPPDLVILDVMMPGMDGYAVARSLRAYGPTASVPIIILTAKSSIDDKVAGFEAGVDDYLTKPIQPAELVSRVKSALAHASSRALEPVAAAGRVVIFMGATAGSGTTTVTVNTALALARAGLFTLLAGIGPGADMLRYRLNLPAASVPLRNLSAEEIGGALIPVGRLLHVFPSLDCLPEDEARCRAWCERCVRAAASLGHVALFDLGSGALPLDCHLMVLAHRLVVVAEASRSSLLASTRLLNDLRQCDGNGARLSVVLIHRQPPPGLVNYRAIQDGLGVDHLAVIEAAPDLFAHAEAAAMPLLVFAPGSRPARSFRTLARDLWAAVQTGS